MSTRPTIELRTDSSPKRAIVDLVMAWAQDSFTNEPRYILELGPDRRGAKCGCTCVGCGEPLVAVNAAKTEFIRRPHFRHQEGVEHGDCVVLAARAAALRQLQDTGWINLPRRRMSAQVAGLSGEFYQAWVERAPERLRIRQVNYRDRVAAVFTFEDGRTLRVELTGSAKSAPGSNDANPGDAAILISVDDPTVAAMAPEEVLRHLTLLPDALCWRSHWLDAALHRDAEDAAREEARLYLDIVPSDLMLPPDMDAIPKRESILHHVAKNILVEEGRVAVPELQIEVEVRASGETLQSNWMFEAATFSLEHIEVEESYGNIVPDIACKGYPEGGGRVYVPMFIEITVSNCIDEARLERIREKKCLALEIDLSLAGGRVTRQELRRLVVEELATKRWLYHPEAEENRTSLIQKLQVQANRRATVLSTPLADIGREYLDAVEAHLKDTKEREISREFNGLQLGTEAGERLADAIDKMAMHGFPEAAASALVASHGILDRILSIKGDAGVGYRLPSGHAVLNAVRQDRADDRAYHSLFLISALKYNPKLTPEQQDKFNQWRGSVRASIRAGEVTYLRPAIFDRLLSLLFPEMALDLGKPGVKRDVRRDLSTPSTRRHEPHDRHPSILISSQPRSDSASWPLRDTPRGSWWLKGRDLDQWKRQNPQWAAMWAGSTPPLGKNEDSLLPRPSAQQEDDGGFKDLDGVLVFSKKARPP